MPEPIAIKKVVVDGKEYDCKVYAPSPVEHQGLRWGQSVRAEKAPYYAYDGPINDMSEYSATKEDQGQ